MDEKPLTVLVVDDDESVRRAMKRLLMSNGYPVLIFESAEHLLHTSLDWELEWEHVCLLLDIRLPALSGFDLYAHLASSKIKCPVIFMTSLDDSKWIERAAEAGAVALLHKPFGEQSLLGAIALACGRADGVDTTPE